MAPSSEDLKACGLLLYNYTFEIADGQIMIEYTDGERTIIEEAKRVTLSTDSQVSGEQFRSAVNNADLGRPQKGSLATQYTIGPSNAPINVTISNFDPTEVVENG